MCKKARRSLACPLSVRAISLSSRKEVQMLMITITCEKCGKGYSTKYDFAAVKQRHYDVVVPCQCYDHLIRKRTSAFVPSREPGMLSPFRPRRDLLE